MPIGPALGAALATGAADFLGGVFTNQGNARQAALNRRFQERMSSTAVQRAVKDYEAAGLNPALAYDRPASSPGGSQAQLENPVSKAVSSGQAAALAKSQLEVNRASEEKMAADTAKTRVEGANALIQGEILSQQRLLMGQDLAQRIAMQPHQVRALALSNMAADLGMDKAKAEAAYYRLMGVAAPMVDNLSGPVGGLLGGGLGAAALLRRGLGVGGSSAAGAAKLFPAPKPRRIGDWERYKPVMVRPPGGFSTNLPPGVR